MSEPLDYIYRLAELDLNVCVCVRLYLLCSMNEILYSLPWGRSSMTIGSSEDMGGDL